MSVESDMVLMPREPVLRVCEGVRRAVQAGALDARSMAADAVLLLEAALAAEAKA